METDKYFWQEKTANGIRIGLNNAGREALGNVKYVNLPNVNQTVAKGKHLLDVEAEKTVLDIDSPVSGELVDVHQEVEDNPDFLDQDDPDKNWLFTVK